MPTPEPPVPSARRPALALALLLPALLLPGRPAPAQAIIPRPPAIDATSHVLVDARTGHVIVEENADEPLPPASLTKIMTAYIAIEEILGGRLSLADEAHISEKAWRMEGSKMFVGVDTRVSVEDLLRGIIVQSGNDASVALAEHIAGGEDAFADMMNRHGEALGMTDSYFMNASGLDTERRYNTMSARDLSILARAVVGRHGEYYPMYAEREFTYNGIRQPNRNALLFRDRGVDGIKTGWTDAAGFCLVASAERDGMRLISVVMGAGSEEARIRETQKLFAYGFRYFETHRLYEAGQTLTSAPVWYGAADEVELGVAEEALVTIPRGQGGRIVSTVNMDEVIRAPIAVRRPMGTVAATLDGETIHEGEVIAMRAVERAGAMKRFGDWLGLLFGGASGR